VRDIKNFMGNKHCVNKFVAFTREATRYEKRGERDLYDYEFILALDASLNTVVADSENCHCKN